MPQGVERDKKLKENARINWKKNRNDISLQCRG
jgi:hypothetical protein